MKTMMTKKISMKEMMKVNGGVIGMFAFNHAAKEPMKAPGLATGLMMGPG